jgi:hypothetical protein
MRPFAFQRAREATAGQREAGGLTPGPSGLDRKPPRGHRGLVAESETRRANPRPGALQESGIALRFRVTLRGGEIAKVRRVIAIAARHRALVRGLVALLRRRRAPVRGVLPYARAAVVERGVRACGDRVVGGGLLGIRAS